MKRVAIGGAFLVLAWAGAVPPADAAAIKTGRWQFTARIEAAAPSATPAAFGDRGAGSGEATYTSCLRSYTSLPTAFGPQCRLDRTEHSGDRFAWSMTCTNSEGTVRSDGVADYHGDAMEATLVNHRSGKDGAAIATTQHITGHYLGPCLQSADLPMSPSHLKRQPGGAAAVDTLEPPAAVAPGKASAAPAAPPADVAAVAPEEPKTHRTHHPHHKRHRHYRYRYAPSGGWFPASGYGPGP